MSTTYRGYDDVSRPIYEWRGYDYVYYQGCAVRPRHLDSLLAAASTPGWGRLNLTQGGLSGSVAASAKTHLYLDVVDISINGHGKSLVWQFCRNLFENGNLPFPRGYVRDSFQNNKHIHDLWFEGGAGHPQLVAQEDEWRRYRGDGLRGNASYTGPDLVPGVWAESMFNPLNRMDAPFSGKVKVIKGALLLGLNRARVEKVERPNGYPLDFTSRIYRWGRWNCVTRFETFYAEQYIERAYDAQS